MTLSTLETGVRAVSQQIRQLRTQRRPRPGHLQLRIDQLLWRCCQEMSLDRFQDVFETIADPLSDLHVQIRYQAYARHGRLDSVRTTTTTSPTAALHLIRWSSSLGDLSLFLRIWAQHAEAVKADRETVWKLAIALSGRDNDQAEFVELLAEVLSAIAARDDDHGGRLAHFLYDCVLRYVSSAGFQAAIRLGQSLQQRIGSARLLSELAALLVKDERCHQSEEFVQQWTCLLRPGP